MTARRRHDALTVGMIVLIAAPFLGALGLIDMRDPGAPDTTIAETVYQPAPTVTAIAEPATVDPTAVAERVPVVVIPPETMLAPTSSWVLPEPVPSGIYGLPFAPAGLDPCAEFEFYRIQWGLPERFDRLAFRESRCIQELGSTHRTSCCVGYLQLFVSQHLDDHRTAPLYAACEVTSEFDVDGPEPIEKQRQLCAAAALYSVAGFTPWRLT